MPSMPCLMYAGRSKRHNSCPLKHGLSSLTEEKRVDVIRLFPQLKGGCLPIILEGDKGTIIFVI